MTTTPHFDGRFYQGDGDVEYLGLLDAARRLFTVDPELPGLPMLYTPLWNGLVEGPKWNAWWIQNSYGPSFCALPFYDEPYTTFLQNSQDLWFKHIGDGRREVLYHHYAGTDHRWTPPDGCLCDAASPDWAVHRQGDGRVEIHDWGMEFTAAGVLLQAELLLISRDRAAIARYLPLLERSAAFIESRRDPATNCFLAGPAANLLAPSYAGWRKPDGSFHQAYLAGLSITYIAALDRLEGVAVLAGRPELAAHYRDRRELAARGLAHLTTAEGYFVKSVDPDGTRHGVLGAAQHGYFEASPNHDAICHRVVDDAQARRIMDRMLSLPGLRPHTFVITNWPGLDDMYETDGIFQYGTWINGGHWATCEARMVMAYCRLGRFEEARCSMRKLLEFARSFHLDAPLKNFGSQVWFDADPTHLCYDAFGAPAAMIRGLFEYRYHGAGLTLCPHIPPTITRLEQRFPIRFGTTRLYLSTVGTGEVTAVRVNGEPWDRFDGVSVTLLEGLPEEAVVQIALGGATLGPTPQVPARATTVVPAGSAIPEPLASRAAGLRAFLARLAREGLANGYVAAHARLAIEAIEAIAQRQALQHRDRLPRLPDATQTAADQSYINAANRLYEGLEKTVRGYATSADQWQRRVSAAWSSGGDHAGGGDRPEAARPAS